MADILTNVVPGVCAAGVEVAVLGGPMTMRQLILQEKEPIVEVGLDLDEMTAQNPHLRDDVTARSVHGLVLGHRRLQELDGFQRRVCNANKTQELMLKNDWTRCQLVSPRHHLKRSLCLRNYINQSL